MADDRDDALAATAKVIVAPIVKLGIVEAKTNFTKLI
jgi:hypothetical protein